MKMKMKLCRWDGFVVVVMEVKAACGEIVCVVLWGGCTYKRVVSSG